MDGVCKDPKLFGDVYRRDLYNTRVLRFLMRSEYKDEGKIMSEDNLENILATLKNSTGAISAIVATSTGLNMIDTVNHNDEDNKIAAMLAAAFGSGQEAMGLKGQGILRQCIFHTDDAVLIIVPAGEKALLALLLSNHFVYDEEAMPTIAIRLAAQKIAEIIK